jgi:sigma-B regulation protein RsbU (phosphoserine phosphatase)
MKPAPIPTDESDRLSELKALNILDTPREPRFDRITELVADVFGVPMVFLTLVDGDRQWFKSTYGINVEATPRDVGFCAHAMLEPQPMVVPNATKDVRFADNPFVTGEFHLRFYAGVPLHGPKGKGIGALALVDTEPREFSPKQVGQLEKFAAIVEREISH